MFGKKEVFLLVIVLLIIGISGYVISAPCSDDDGDGVCNNADLCPNSLPGERIDKDGCDPFQFCKQFYCGSECYYADFMDNEQHKEVPFDCTVVILNKEGKQYPRCTPVRCEKDLKVPSDVFINMSVRKGINSTFDVTLWDVPSGYDVHDGIWSGWCGAENITIHPRDRHDAKLYSSYDPNLALLCPHCADDDWDMVNYIINNKQGPNEEVQHAIWYFLGNETYPKWYYPDARAMVDEALLYGEGFWPQSGQLMAIIIEGWHGRTEERVQLIFIEVDP